MLQTKQTTVPYFRTLSILTESFRPEIQQYFVENEADGTPISKEFRALIYQRAKGARDTRPFCKISGVDRVGYKWVNHSLQPKHLTDFTQRISLVVNIALSRIWHPH